LRAEALRERVVIAKVEKQKDGVAIVRPEFSVDLPTEKRPDEPRREQ
jgi:hypothetical protein